MASQLLVNALLLFSGLLLVILTRYTVRTLSVQFTLRLVPGPKSPSLLWGQESLLYHTTPGTHYLEWHRQFGKVLKFHGAFGHYVLSITDPRAITFILGEGIYSFPKPSGVRAWFRATLGEGILWIEGKEAHERQRKTLAPALNQQSVRKYTPIFYVTSAKMAMQWTRLFDQCQSDAIEIEVTNWAGRFALDTIVRAAFSYDLDCLSGEPHALAEALDGLTNQENKRSSFYMRALFWIFPSILSIGKKGEMIRKTNLELGELASRMWMDAQVAGDPEGKTLMAIIKMSQEDGQKMNEKQMVAQMRTIISAGYEPVSATISWVLYELACNPDIQRKLRDEISSVQDPSFDDLTCKLPFLDAVIRETIRLHPPILENHHEALETISVPLSEPIPGTDEPYLVIPKGTILEIPVNVVQSDPEIWGPDAHVFRPMRWLDRKEKPDRPRTREIFAFSEGPRSCIGKAFAMCEIKVLIITLIRQFSLSCPYEIEPFQSFVVRPRIKGQGSSSLPLVVRKL